jgi:hypothetical protein
MVPRLSGEQRDECEKQKIAVEGTPLADAYDRQAEEEIAQGIYQTLDDDADLDEMIPRRSPESGL